jgi:hypothetical protein
MLCCAVLCCAVLCRYEGLQRQLVDAQAAAEIEEEEAELARAAAAVARLVAPDSPSSTAAASPSSTAAGALSNGSSRGGMSSLSSVDISAPVSDDEGSGPAAAKLRMLEQELKEAREEVHAAPEDDAPAAGMSMRH